MAEFKMLKKAWRFALALAVSAGLAVAGEVDVKIEKWPDGKKAAFLLQFDDGCISQLNNAVPELKKRGMVGTFYVITNAGHFTGNLGRWEKEIPAAGQVLGNHTFSHKGAQSVEELDEEVSKAQDTIKRIMKYDKPHLIAFGQPGGVPWKVSNEDLEKVLKKYDLVNRPPFWGATIHLKNLNDYVQVIDKAVKSGEMGHIDFHGTGGDWLGPKTKEEFVAIIDKVDERKADLWVTDMISWHQYKKEREGPKVSAAAAGKDVKVKLECATDAALYDLPLDVSIAAPKGWKGCKATQGGKEIPAVLRDGRVVVKAAPVSGEILVSPK